MKNQLTKIGTYRANGYASPSFDVFTNFNNVERFEIEKNSQKMDLVKLNTKFNAVESFSKNYGCFYNQNSENTVTILSFGNRAKVVRKWNGSKFVDKKVDFTTDRISIATAWTFSSYFLNSIMSLNIRMNTANGIMYFDGNGDFVVGRASLELYTQTPISQTNLLKNFKQKCFEKFGDSFLVLSENGKTVFKNSEFVLHFKTDCNNNLTETPISNIHLQYAPIAEFKADPFAQNIKINKQNLEVINFEEFWQIFLDNMPQNALTLWKTDFTK